MNDQEIEKEILNARREDNTYPVEWVMKMNNAGVWFQFSNDGIRWRRQPFV
ncbi:hypothetical protein D3C78_1722170 [compost metagenome]